MTDENRLGRFTHTGPLRITTGPLADQNWAAAGIIGTVDLEGVGSRVQVRQLTGTAEIMVAKGPVVKVYGPGDSVYEQIVNSLK